jgi:ech hydrogenase subunit F
MFGMLSPILKNAFGKPATRMYPFVTREAFANARGKLEIDINDCIFCGMCQRKCPSTCLTVDKATCKWELNPFNCIICGVCVEACPKKCLSLNKVYRTPAYVKENLVSIGKPPVKKTEAKENA